jgi:hypothetical protein
MILEPEDAGGVIPLLLLVSAFAAMERGSDCVELRDLIKAIYVVDLEHVATYWNDWEGFETLVSSEKLVTGVQSGAYINRTLYLIGAEQIRSEGGSITACGSPSEAFGDVIAAARELARTRQGFVSTPTSRDLLFTCCNQDKELARELQKSGLQFDKLAAAVRKKRQM